MGGSPTRSPPLIVLSSVLRVSGVVFGIGVHAVYAHLFLADIDYAVILIHDHALGELIIIALGQGYGPDLSLPAEWRPSPGNTCCLPAKRPLRPRLFLVIAFHSSINYGKRYKRRTAHEQGCMFRRKTCK